MMRDEADSGLILGMFMGQTQGANMERIQKTTRSARIISDEPLLDTPKMTMLERRKMVQAHEHASRLETENTILRSQVEELERLAFADTLTGLPNRLVLEQHFIRAHDHARATGETLAFAIADIDLFEQMNDRYGHATGDAVVREVAAILRSNGRITDLAARLGGEEFAIVMPGLIRHEAFNAYQRLRRAVEEFDWSSITHGLRITLSIGLTDSICETPAATLPMADRQMYRAKLEGRNRVLATRGGL
jgi:diguanylate cyclase (GGDEF)-like protein